MRETTPVTLGGIADLPVQSARTVRLRCTPEQLFQSFERADDWKAWLGLEITWTSPPPHGPGPTRLVRVGPALLEETFLDWRHGEQMAFTITRANVPVLRQLAERWVVTPTAEGCELRWQLGARLAPYARLAQPGAGVPHGPGPRAAVRCPRGTRLR